MSKRMIRSMHREHPSLPCAMRHCCYSLPVMTGHHQNATYRLSQCRFDGPRQKRLSTDRSE